MPTESFKPILDREAVVELAKPVTDLASPILREAVNYATNAYARCSSSKRGTQEEAYPVLASYVHLIQMVDSIEVLISNSCAAPAELLLRSSFEGKLTIEYILEKRSRSKKRAYAWLGKYLIDNIELHERFSPNHPKSKEFEAIYNNDQLRETGEFPFLPEISEVIDKMKKNLNKPEYAEVYAEYQKRRKQTRHPEWYSLYNGPKNLRELAQHLHQGVIYEILYRSWSKMSHAVDSRHVTFPMEDGSSVIANIRNPMRIPGIAGLALSFLLETTKMMLLEYRSGEQISFHRWWNQEISNKHFALSAVEISGLDWYYKKFIEKSIKEVKEEPNS